MAGKRKFLQEHKNEWTKAEKAFVAMCSERNWIVENEDETGTPILNPSRAKNAGIYRVAAHGMDGDTVLIGLCVTAIHGKTKKALLDKAEKANLNGTILAESDTDLYYAFPIERLPRAVKTFNLRKKQNHSGPPKEAIEKGQAALAAYREKKKLNGD